MKHNSIIIGLCLSFCVAYNAYSLTCVKKPTCEELGYTTDALFKDWCINAPKFCPFDKNKISCLQENDILEVLKPDWSRAKPLITHNTAANCDQAHCRKVTSPGNGFVIGVFGDIHNYGARVVFDPSSTSRREISLTGIRNQRQYIYHQVYKGQRLIFDVYMNPHATGDKIYFVPFKGDL